MRAVVEETEAALPPGAWPAWTGSNHDMFRFPTRWAGGDPDKARAALLMLLGLRGTPVLYQGDEIGQLDATLTKENLRDPLGVLYWPHYAGRDAGRTPMQWRDVPGGGFTDPDVVPWLPLGDLARHNVESQRSDPDSILTLARDLIALRRLRPDLRGGSYRSLEAAVDVWAWSRGERTVVVVNMSEDEVTWGDVDGKIALCTDRRRDGEAIEGPLRLGPWVALVADRR
jgi:alpha-glucosidase